MAERRMFTLKIVDSDAFLEMPLSAQALYFHLCMRADDDGFINNAKKIQRMVNASDDDLKLLIAKRFLLVCESGVIVVKHWRMHNYLRKDRHSSTQYVEELSKLAIKENGAYTDNVLLVDQMTTNGIPSVNQNTTKCLPSDNQVVDQCVTNGSQVVYQPTESGCQMVENRLTSGCPSIVKDSIGEYREEENSKDKISILLMGGGVYEVEDGFIKLLQAKYPNLNIYDELSKISDYFNYYPNKLQTMATIKQYILDWFKEVIEVYEAKRNG